MKSILVIGGAGYIGSHVCRAFLDKQYSVTVYDNMSSGCRENLFPEAAFIKGDILDYDFLRDSMKRGFDCLVHLAAFKAAGESMIMTEKYSVNAVRKVEIPKATGGIRILGIPTVNDRFVQQAIDQ